jgi:hypothetical protein
MLRPKRPFAALGALCIAVAAGSFARAATPTPEPGGAQQVAGVEGTLKSTLFNGQVRVRKMILGKPSGTPDESYTDTPQTTWLAFRSLMSNGTPHVLDMQQFGASLVDADGVVVAAQPDKVRPIGSVTGIPPGGAWHENIFFDVPAGFVPVKIVLVPAAAGKAFRIDLAATDLPK